MKSALTDACTIKLQNFEGPFDLLFYLIEKNQIDIYDIPILEITEQYLDYLNAMQELDLDIASEFLVMAATLLHIKSRMLLPKRESLSEEEAESADPREELIIKLLEYKKYKEIAVELKNMEAFQSRIIKRNPEDLSFLKKEEFSITNLTLDDLMSTYLNIINAEKRVEPIHIVKRDLIPISRKIKDVFKYICSCSSIIKFSSLLKNIRSKAEKIVTFLAVLELIKMNKISAEQESIFGEITIYRKGGPHHESRGSYRNY